MNFKTPISRLRLLAILEGVSFLLFGITMPLKYWFDMPAPNFYVGMTHGWLFIAYVGFCLQNIYLHRWGAKTSMISLAASLVPFGTFYTDAKIFKPTQEGKLQG